MSGSRRNVPVVITLDDGYDDDVRIVSQRNVQRRGRGRSSVRAPISSRPELVVLSDEEDEGVAVRSRSPIIGRSNPRQRVVRLGVRQQRPVVLPSRDRTVNTRPVAVVRPTVRRNRSQSSSVRSWDPYDPATDDEYDENYDDDDTFDFNHGEHIALFVD